MDVALPAIAPLNTQILVLGALSGRPGLPAVDVGDQLRALMAGGGPGAGPGGALVIQQQRPRPPMPHTGTVS